MVKFELLCILCMCTCVYFSLKLGCLVLLLFTFSLIITKCIFYASKVPYIVKQFVFCLVSWETYGVAFPNAR